MIEWQQSGPEPGKDYSDILVARDDPGAGVIILTGAVGMQQLAGAPDFPQFSRRPWPAPSAQRG
ncbi:MAG: hypothetical protein ACRDOB_11025 [Streptosporangiaceae bacterium]